MFVKTKGIVLRSVKYSETSLILDIFTLELGLRTYIINGVRKKNARTGAAMLQPLNILDLLVYNKESAKINRIKEVKLSYIYKKLNFDIKKSSVGLFILELLWKSLKEKESNPKLFEYVENSLIFLDQTSRNISNFHLIFLIKMSNFLGFYPVNNFDVQNNYFDLREGKFKKSIPSHQDYLNKEESELFSKAMKIDLEQPDLLKFRKEERSRLLEKLILYYKIHLTDFGKIRTLEVFKKVFEK